MGLLDFIPVVGPAINAVAGLASESNARDAFKHRYQDTVNDLRAAGLNPALAYSQGGGNPSTSDLPDVGSDIGTAVQQINSAKQSKAAAKAQEANADLTTAQANLLKAQTADLINQIALRNKQIATDTGLAAQNTKRAGAETASTALDVKRKGATLQSDIAGTKAANTLKTLQVPRQQIETAAATGAQSLLEQLHDAVTGTINDPIRDHIWAAHMKAVHAKAVQTYHQRHPR